jgi:hypothetical protein
VLGLAGHRDRDRPDAAFAGSLRDRQLADEAERVVDARVAGLLEEPDALLQQRQPPTDVSLGPRQDRHAEEWEADPLFVRVAVPDRQRLLERGSRPVRSGRSSASSPAAHSVAPTLRLSSTSRNRVRASSISRRAFG